MYKSLRILAAVFLGLMVFASKAQTIMASGKLDGSNTTNTHIERMVQGSSDQNVLIGWFTDSLHLDYSSGTNTIMGGAAGAKNGFVASYDAFGSLIFGIPLKGSSLGDSCIIRTVYVDYADNIYIGGSFYGTIDFDGYGGITSYSATVGADGFLAKYNSSGNLLWATPLATDGANGAVTAISFNGSGYLVAGGYWDGVMDADPLAGPTTDTTVTGIDGFITLYDATAGSFIGNWMAFFGAGNETIEALYVDGANNIFYTGQFDATVDVDPGPFATSFSTAGGKDIFLCELDYTSVLVQSIQLGGTGTDYMKDLYSDGGLPVLLVDYNSTFDMDPHTAGVYMASTAGSYDVALLRYDSGLNLIKGSTFGNAGANHGGIIVQEMNALGGLASFYMYLFTMTYSGTMDVDPNAGTINITSANTPVNSVAITIDDMGMYFTHFTNEAQLISGVCINGNSPQEFTIAGDFKGTSVDIAPLAAVSTQTHTTNYAGYYIFYDRCAVMTDVVLTQPYECGTPTATLVANATGGGGAGPYTYNWSNFDSDSVTTGYDGTYYCTVTDFLGCAATDTIKIGHYGSPALSATISTVPTTCGNNFGSASAVPVNNFGPATWLWSNGDTTNAADSLVAGFYTLQVLDTTGCFVIVPFDISDSDGPVVTLVSATAPLCGGISTGAIDVTVTGGAAPVTFAWSNGATTEDITGVPGGSYALIATDAGGCVGQICVNIAQPDPLSIIQNNLINSNCLAANGQIMIQPQGGTAPYTIQWDASTGFQTNDTVVNLAAGIYNVQITDAAGCTYNEYYAVGDQEYYWAPSVYFAGETAASCAGGPGSTYVDVYGSGSYTYLWENGATTEDLLTVPGGKHCMIAYDVFGGCYTSYTTYLSSIQPNIPDVCMVTVDSTGTQNVVVYDETTTPEAVYYNIYREGFCGSSGFTRIGSVDRDSLSVFYDTVVNSDLRSWKYYVTAVDSCGQESAPSVINKTIHLSIYFNSNFDLVCNWEAYEGLPVSGYNVYRINPAGTAYDSIFNVGPSQLTWTDTTNFTPWTGNIEYYVEGIPVSTCYASRAYNQNNARSNHAKAGILVDTTSGSGIAVEQVNLDELVKIYPNPANDRVNIKIVGGTVNGYKIDMLDQVGQTVRSFNLNGETGISTRDLNAGVYFVRVTNVKLKQTKTFKLVISR